MKKSSEKKPDRRKINRVPDGIRQRLAQARGVWTHEELSKVDVGAVVVKNRGDVHGDSAHGLNGFVVIVEDADRGMIKLLRPTPERGEPQRNSMNQFERAAYHILGLYPCQRVQWGPPGTKPCEEQPGMVQLCSTCNYCQMTGQEMPTKERLAKYMERER